MKNINLYKQNSVLHKHFLLNGSITLSAHVLNIYINRFWNDVFQQIVEQNNTKDIHLLLMCKVEFSDVEMGYRSLADLRKVRYNDMQAYVDFLTLRLGKLTEAYQVTAVHKIVITYIIKDGKPTDPRLLRGEQEYNVSKHSYNNQVLPLTTNINDYGRLIIREIFNDSITYVVEGSNGDIFQIDVDKAEKIFKVRILGKIDISWVDTIVHETGIFKREIGASTIFVQDGQILLKKKNLPAKPFKTVKPHKKITSKNQFLTFDVETVSIDGLVTPYLIAGYSTGGYMFSYASDISKESQANMFTDFLTQMIKLKNVKYVYAHNLAGFDGILLLKHLITF